MDFLSHLLNGWTFGSQLIIYLAIMALIGILAMKLTHVPQIRYSFATVAATVVYFVVMLVFTTGFSIFLSNMQIPHEQTGMYLGGGIGSVYFVATTIYYRTLNKHSKPRRLIIG